MQLADEDRSDSVRRDRRLRNRRDRADALVQCTRLGEHPFFQPLATFVQTLFGALHHAARVQGPWSSPLVSHGGLPCTIHALKSSCMACHSRSGLLASIQRPEDVICPPSITPPDSASLMYENACIFMYMHVHACTHACTCMYMHVYACIIALHMYVYACICTSQCMYMYVCMYLYVYVCICVYMHICTHMHVDVCMHVFCMYMYVFAEKTPSDTETDATTPEHSL
jgi:hypothetical protein